MDLTTAQFGPSHCFSDPSSNPTLSKETGLDWSNDYSQKEKKPRCSDEPKNITAYRPDGNQNVNIQVKYAGKNFAFPGANGIDALEEVGLPKDTPHKILGGQVSDGKNYLGKSSVFPFEAQSPITYNDGLEVRFPLKQTDEKWSGMVPDLDVLNTVSLRINRDKKKVDVSSIVTGDGFPNCESFIIDGSNKVLFLASHVRTGTAIAQLPGDRQIPMNNTSLESDWEADDSFGAQVNVRVALDFTGAGAAHDLGTGAKSREQWNKVNTGRSAYGAYSQRVRDHVPLPQNQWVDDRINNNPAVVDGVRKVRDAALDALEWWRGED